MPERAMPDEDDGRTPRGPKVLTIEKVTVEHTHFDQKQMLMGTAFRSPVTGKVRLREYNYPDFSLVDLWTRDELSGSPSGLAQDKYIFRPRPLAYRTWIYHDMFREKVVLPPDLYVDTPIENRLLKHVLAQRCIDQDCNAGRWSPLMVYVTIAMAACLTGNILLMGVALGTCLIIYVISEKFAVPAGYRFSRMASGIFRLGFTGVTGAMSGNLLAAGLPSIIGASFVIVAVCVDFIAGDLMSFVNYRYTCNYEIVKSLPNRVFVVRQHGGAIGFSEDAGCSFDQRLTIMGSLDKAHKLVADIEGLIVELTPTHPDMFDMIDKEFMEKAGNGAVHKADDYEPTRFVGLDVFNTKLPTVRKMDEAEGESDICRVRLAAAGKENKQELTVEDADGTLPGRPGALS